MSSQMYIFFPTRGQQQSPHTPQRHPPQQQDQQQAPNRFHVQSAVLTMTDCPSPSFPWDRGPHPTESPRYGPVDAHHKRQTRHPRPEDHATSSPWTPPPPLHQFPQSTCDLYDSRSPNTTCATPLLPSVLSPRSRSNMPPRSHVWIPWSGPIDCLNHLLRVIRKRHHTFNGVPTPSPFSTTGLVATSRCKVGRSLNGSRSSLLLWEFTWSCSTKLHSSHNGSCRIARVWVELLFPRGSPWSFAVCGFLTRLAQVSNLPSFPQGTRFSPTTGQQEEVQHTLERNCCRRDRDAVGDAVEEDTHQAHLASHNMGRRGGRREAPNWRAFTSHTIRCQKQIR